MMEETASCAPLLLREAVKICLRRTQGEDDSGLIARWWHASERSTRPSTDAGEAGSLWGSTASLSIPASADSVGVTHTTDQSSADRQAEARQSREDETVGRWCARGAVCMSEGKHIEAMRAFQLALEHKRDCLRALVGMGYALVAQRRLVEAIGCFEAGLAIDARERWAHFGLGWSALLAGDFERGWEEMQWFNRSGRTRHIDARTWTGEALDGQTLLVWADWALGDTIQHLRYLPLARARVGKLVVECDKALAPLVERMTCVDLVAPSGTPLPRHDMQAPLSSLAGVLSEAHRLNPTPVPYLHVSSSANTAWQARLGTSRKPVVGLVWTGDTSHAEARARFTTLAHFRPLAAAGAVRFVSLQVGRPALAVEWESSLAVDNILDERCSIEDTAAAILQLDLVITVDTMVAHLAGALGQRVWTLLSFSPAWLWQIEGERSSWYPTMRLYRQTSAGDWDDVMRDVSRDLSALFSTWPS